MALVAGVLDAGPDLEGVARRGGQKRRVRRLLGFAARQGPCNEHFAIMGACQQWVVGQSKLCPTPNPKPHQLTVLADEVEVEPAVGVLNLILTISLNVS